MTRYKEKPLDSPYGELMSIQNTVRRNLDRVVEIELLQIVGEEKIQTGTGTTPIYKPTIFGLLLAWLIEYQNIFDTEIRDIAEDQNRMKIASDEIYNILQEILKKGKRYAPSTFVLYSKFFEICKEQKIFGNLIQLMNAILLSEDDIITMENFIHRLMEFDFKNSENSKLQFRLLLWKDSLNALDERTKNIFLHNIKLDIERKVEEELKNVGGYERLRLTALQHPEMLVVFESKCIKCPYYIPAAMEVSVYKKRMILANIDSSKLSGLSLEDYKREMKDICSDLHPSILLAKCSGCNVDNSLKIPFFIN